MIKIYFLIDPRTDSPFYVGASKAGLVNIAYRHVTHPNGLRGLLVKKKIGFGIVVIDQAETVEGAAQLEEYWFWQLRAWGYSLDNYFKKSFKRYNPSCIYMYA